MIESKEDLKRYLEEDRIANYKTTKKPRFGRDLTWRFLIALRKLEYNMNVTKSPIRVLWSRFVWYHYSVKTGFTIHPNCFEEGLYLPHYGTIICNENTRGGRNITLQCNVVIARNVILGNSIYLAPGVNILQNVKIPDNTTIGANSVVTRSIEKGGVYVGAPVRLIKGNTAERQLAENVL